MPTGTFNIVDDYAADNTGSADASTAIQNALSAANAAGGGTVVFPPGTYKLVTGVYMPGDNIRIVAYGATILRSATSTATLMLRSGMSSTAYSGPSNIKISGGTWDANAANNTLNCDIFLVSHGSNWSIEDVTFQNVPDWHAIELDAVQHGRVTNCRFRGFRLVTASRYFSEAIQMEETTADGYTSWDIIVEKCRMEPYGGYGGFGKLFGTHTTTPGLSHQAIKVLGNTIIGAMDYGIGGMNWRNCVIAQNTFQDCNGMIRVNMSSTSTCENWWQSQAESPVVVNNIGDGIGGLQGGPSQKRAAIEISGYDADQVIENSVVAHNIIRNWTNAYGILQDYVHESVTDGNVLKYNNTAGTAIGVTNNSGCTITGNNIRYAGFGVVTTGSSSIFNSNNRFV